MSVMKSKIRTLILCGVLAPIMYITAAIIGGLLAPEYNHVRDSVSDLLKPGAPNKALLDTLMFLSNILTILGSLAVIIIYLKTINKLVKAGIILILISGILSAVSAHVFRLPMGPEMTISGIIHIAIVALLVLISMALILMIGFGMNKYKN